MLIGKPILWEDSTPIVQAKGAQNWSLRPTEGRFSKIVQANPLALPAYEQETS